MRVRLRTCWATSRECFGANAVRASSRRSRTAFAFSSSSMRSRVRGADRVDLDNLGVPQLAPADAIDTFEIPTGEDVHLSVGDAGDRSLQCRTPGGREPPRPLFDVEDPERARRVLAVRRSASEPLGRRIIAPVDEERAV